MPVPGYSLPCRRLKTPEQLVGILRIEAYSVIADREHPLRALAFGRNVNVRRFIGLPILQSIADQVLKKLNELHPVDSDRRQMIVGYDGVTLRNGHLEIHHRRGQHGLRIDKFRPAVQDIYL